MSTHVSNTIEYQTRGQSENPRWAIERQHRLTASNFYELLHARDMEAFCRKLHDRKHQHPTNIPACKFGLEAELPAMRAYAAQFAIDVGCYYQPGLCVSKHFPNLAATPDFIVFADPYAKPQPPASSYGAWLVEVKAFMDNPKANTLQELAALRGKNFCLEFTPNGEVAMRKEHKFYHQIIGQLNIVFGEDPYAFCDLVMCYKHYITTVRIYNDLEHWKLMRDRLLNATYVYSVCK
jgi:hypothetical protein